nr:MULTISPECIES: hypothetical protein [unclassified Thermosynechococcus]
MSFSEAKPPAEMPWQEQALNIVMGVNDHLYTKNTTCSPLPPVGQIALPPSLR